jgi:hypothetical protein
MPTTLNADTLARLLPGTWRIGATNFPMWIDGQRISPTFSYELKSTTPLVLSDRVTWRTVAGVEKKRLGVDRWRGTEFVWHGKGLLRPFGSRWGVAGASDDGSILVIRFSKSLATPAGVDVVIREEADAAAVRSAVATASDTLGLGHEEFASLTWLDLDLPRGVGRRR